MYIGISRSDWVIVFATLVGPILAVQAQKAVETIRERRHRKASLFEKLMATRAARISPEHVRALNMIDLVFYGQRRFGVLRRSGVEQQVLDAWKEYLDHLNTKAENDQVALWVARGDELFINLLFSISQDLGYRFDRVQLKRGSYSPVAHGEIEAEQNELRRAALSLVSGKHAMQMNVVGFPVDQDAIDANKAVLKNFGKALESGALQVEMAQKE